MRVLLIATGENHALAPLTNSIPSPMLPVINRPVMEHNIELLARQGFKDILVSL
ncbi:MAG: nucleotidyltransferase family protein, partial [Anaerolineales bacterium]|nr:nucleotidyltransferase family protein [Anaerolineales bacterium]